MDHVRGAPYHPQTQGKIERWHQTMKNRVLLEHYFLPGVLPDEFELVFTWTEKLSFTPSRDRATRRGRQRGFA
jgi:transposase InsO family protein